MTMSLMPRDLPLPLEPGDRNQISNQATATEVVTRQGPDGIFPYDPWINANVAKMSDHSQPEIGEYGEPTYYKGGAITAEWGGMPSVVEDYQNIDGAVILVRRQMHPWDSGSNSTGRFFGPQQTAWESSYVDPTADYWSVILGQE